MRHSFVSLLSDNGVLLEDISRLVGHKSTEVTELIYRKQIRPVMQTGATAMDAIFGSAEPGPKPGASDAQDTPAGSDDTPREVTG
jgi:hypothetical protein